MHRFFFHDIAHAVQDLNNFETDVKVAFVVLCGIKNIAEAKHFLPPDLALYF